MRLKNKQIEVVTNFDIGSNRLINVANPINDNDVVTKTYFESNSTPSVWGQVTGTIGDQTDLISALNSKKADFTENTGFNKVFGITSGTVAEGNHTHSIISHTLSGNSIQVLDDSILTNILIDLATNKIVNLGTPDNNYDAATKKYVDDLYGGIDQSGTQWGEITGTLSNQTDLQSALNNKSSLAHVHALTLNKLWIGDINNLPSEVDVVQTTISVGDFTGDYTGLATETNWVNNFTNNVVGITGDFHFGVGDNGTSYYCYYGQMGWNRVYTDNRITLAGTIALLQTTGNWTTSTYNCTTGDLNQIYIDSVYEYRCIDGILHTWYRNLKVSDVVVTTDISFLPYPQIEVNKYHGDSFIIPAKTDIVSIIVEAETTTAGNITIGSTGTQEVSNLLITSACTITGTVDIILNGVTFNVTIPVGTTIVVAAAIRAMSFTGYTTGQGATTSDITFTSTKYKTETDATYALVTATGGAGTMTTTIQGVNPNADIVVSTALPIVIGEKKKLLYLENINFPTDTNRTVYIGIDSVASVIIRMINQKLYT